MIWLVTDDCGGPLACEIYAYYFDEEEAEEGRDGLERTIGHPLKLWRVALPVAAGR